MRRPDPEQLAQLTPMERFAFRFTAGVNGTPALKWTSQRFLNFVGKNWVHVSTKNLQRRHGFEALTALRPPGGVMIVSNHRSFFDMYVIATTIYKHTKLTENFYFPVRSTFFYEGLGGMFVNATMAGFSMFPPMMRQGTKKAFNRYSLDLLKELLEQKGTVVGYHPEGTRNRSGDPYALLPAKPGAGELAYHAHPLVIPFFVNGLRTEGLVEQVRGNFDRSGEKIWIVAGEPLELGRFYDQPDTQATYKAISEAMLDEIRKLGELEQRLRAAEG